MEEYLKNWHTFDKRVVYSFENGKGGIADGIKFFMALLNICIEKKLKIHYLITNSNIEELIKLKISKFYIEKKDLPKTTDIKNKDEFDSLKSDTVYVARPGIFYKEFNFNKINNVANIFYFSDKVIENSKNIFPHEFSYIGLHLRLGDMHLETDKNFVKCQNDSRGYNQENIEKFIERNMDKNIFFCCDNQAKKNELVHKYSNLFVANCKIGHTSLLNTTSEQVIDTVSELYLLTKATKVYGGSYSGFSIIASKLGNIPYERI